MSKTTSRIYQISIKAINSLPLAFRNLLIMLIKKTGLPSKRFYRDLKYIGKFNIRTSFGKFCMYATGGTIENEIFWKGLYKSLEPETIVVWEKLSQQSKVIVDIGANTGVYGLLSKTVHPGSQVYCFEPSRNTYNELQKNIECNGYEIKSFRLALSDRKGESVFYDTFDKHQTSASLSPKKLKENPGFHGAIIEYPVKTMTLDEFVIEHNISSVDLVKIDVELHEPEVITGMSNVIKTFLPFVVIEVLIPEVAERLNFFFTHIPYRIFHMVVENKSLLLNEVKAFEGRINFDWNYLACPNEKIQLLKSFFNVIEK